MLACCTNVLVSSITICTPVEMMLYALLVLQLYHILFVVKCL